LKVLELTSLISIILDSIRVEKSSFNLATILIINDIKFIYFEYNYLYYWLLYR